MSYAMDRIGGADAATTDCTCPEPCTHDHENE